MFLRTGGGSLDLRIVGWESELDADAERDLTDWLDVECVVVDGLSTRVYDVLLDVEDALRIAPWLRQVAGGSTAPAAGLDEVGPLTFIEPGFVVELITRDELMAATRWFFNDPAGEVNRWRFNARAIDIACPRTDLLSCADTWADELAPYVSG